MNTVVCVKQVVDTEAEKRLQPGDWRLDRTVENILNPYDEYAVEAAIQLKESLGGEVTVLCMGPDAAEDAVRKALAMGADKAVMVTDAALEGSDAQGTAYALSQALKTARVRPRGVRRHVHRRADRAGPRRAGRVARPAHAGQRVATRG